MNLSLAWFVFLRDVCACVTVICVCCSSGLRAPGCSGAQWRILGPVRILHWARPQFSRALSALGMFSLPSWPQPLAAS